MATYFLVYAQSCAMLPWLDTLRRARGTVSGVRRQELVAELIFRRNEQFRCLGKGEKRKLNQLHTALVLEEGGV
jgi:hypothetical protein